MKSKFRLFHAALAATLALSGALPLAVHAGDMPAPAAPAFVERIATRDTLQQLRGGGYVLYLRHGYTDNTRPDRMPEVDLNDCSTQRPLSAEGKKLSEGIGDAMRKARIPIGEMHISPLCRVRDTVSAAFPRFPAQVDLQLMYTANLTTEQKAPIIANTRRLLSTPVAGGSNRMLVAHGPNLMDLIGYFPKEGTLVVFRPGGEGSFEYIASVPPGLWPDLLR